MEAALRDFVAAKKSLEEALSIRRKVLSEGHPDIAHTLMNLGTMHYEMGEYASALDDYKKALAILRRAQPAHSPWLAMTLSNLAVTEMDLGQYVSAKKNTEEALAIRRKILPAGHPNIVASVSNLALIQWNLGEYATAKTNLEDVLASRRKSLPTTHPDIVIALNNLARVQIDLGEYPAAKKNAEEGVLIARRSLPDGHPLIATLLDNLGLALAKMRDYPTAKRNLEEALAIRRKVLSKDHHHTARSLTNLGDLERELGDYAAASKHQEEALALATRSLGTDHPFVADILTNLALVQGTLDNVKAAKKNQERAVAILRKALAPEHPKMADALTGLGVMCDLLEEYEAAKNSHEQALAIRRKVWPKEHPDIAQSLFNLGDVQRSLGDLVGARKSHGEALTIYRKVLPDHPHFALTLFRLGVDQALANEFAGARRSLQEALAIQRKALPPDHPNLGMTVLFLAMLDIETGADSRDVVLRLTEAADILLASEVRLAVGQTEKDQFASSARSSLALHGLIGAGLADKVDPTLLYDRVLRVTCVGQWTDDLQRQGIPAVELASNHFLVVTDDIWAKKLTKMVREKHPRWNEEQVRVFKAKLGDEEFSRGAYFARIDRRARKAQEDGDAELLVECAFALAPFAPPPGVTEHPASAYLKQAAKITLARKNKDDSNRFLERTGIYQVLLGSAMKDQVTALACGRNPDEMLKGEAIAASGRIAKAGPDFFDPDVVSRGDEREIPLALGKAIILAVRPTARIDDLAAYKVSQKKKSGATMEIEMDFYGASARYRAMMTVSISYEKKRARIASVAYQDDSPVPWGLDRLYVLKSHFNSK